VPVNRCADNGDDYVRRSQTLRVGGGGKSFAQDLAQNGLSTSFTERHLAGVDFFDLGWVDIEERNG
jgi:hypothetical protein